MPSLSTILIISILILKLTCSTVKSESQPTSSFRKKEEVGIQPLLPVVEDETTPANDGCQLSAKISCTIDYNQESCDDMIIQPGECDYVDITFEYGVCNEGRTTINMVLGQTHGHVLKDTFQVKLPNVVDLGPKECRMFSRSTRTNMCTNFYSTDMVMEGWVRDDGMWRFCKAEDQFNYVRHVLPQAE